MPSSARHSLPLATNACVREGYGGDKNQDVNPRAAGRRGFLSLDVGSLSSSFKRRYHDETADGEWEIVPYDEPVNPSSIMTGKRTSVWPSFTLLANDDDGNDIPPVSPSMSSTIHPSMTSGPSNQIIATSVTTPQPQAQSRSCSHPLSPKCEERLSSSLHDNRRWNHPRSSILPTDTVSPRTVGGSLLPQHPNAHTSIPSLPSYPRTYNSRCSQTQEQHEMQIPSPTPPCRQRLKNVFLFSSVSNYLAPPSIASRKYVDKHFDIAAVPMESYHTTMTMMMKSGMCTGVNKSNGPSTTSVQ